MINPFNRFYDTEISVYEIGENTYDKEGEKSLIGTIICDVQPCGADAQSREYGLSENRAYKIFSDKNDIIAVGRYILFCGGWYRIIRSEKNLFGQNAVIRGIDDAY